MIFVIWSSPTHTSHLCRAILWIYTVHVIIFYALQTRNITSTEYDTRVVEFLVARMSQTVVVYTQGRHESHILGHTI